MTTCPSTTLVGEGVAQDVRFTTSIFAGTQEDFCADVTGANGPVDLLIDVPSGGSVTLTVHGGDGPVAGKDKSYFVPMGSCTCIPVSTGETVHADGMLYFSLSSPVSLALIKPRVAVVKHIRVNTH